MSHNGRLLFSKLKGIGHWTCKEGKAIGLQLPKKGKSRAELRGLMHEARAGDVDWRRGRVASLVFYAGDEILETVKEAYLMFFSENGLSPSAFPSLRRFESEVVAMVADLLHGEGAVGTLTAGGTESLLLAVKTARDWAFAQRPEVRTPEIVMPATAHPALDKAAHYFRLRAVRVPVGEDFRADIAALREAITGETVLLVGSAPGYVHGVIDPIEAIAGLAAERGILCHVDACMGGFVLPFLPKLGYAVPPFDLRVEGVTSISADLHKYGFSAKGASALLYRSEALHRHQGFEFGDWPSGRYRTETLAGTRPGGAIAAAWAVMQALGEEGYLTLVERVMTTTARLIQGINGIPGLQVWGSPAASLFGYGSRTLDIFAVADGMVAKGWFVNRQQDPPGIHLTVTPAHEPIVEEYLADLAAVAETVGKGLGRTGDSTVAYN